MKIDIENDRKTFTLKKVMEYPDKIYMSEENNFSDNYIAGRKLTGRGEMFYIYNKNTNSIIDIDYYLVIRNLPHDIGMINATVLALNEEKNRIVAGMYFFDLILLYNLTGERIKTFRFSDDCIPNSNKLGWGINKRVRYS
jgi:hypothetical protein